MTGQNQPSSPILPPPAPFRSPALSSDRTDRAHLLHALLWLALALVLAGLAVVAGGG